MWAYIGGIAFAGIIYVGSAMAFSQPTSHYVCSGTLTLEHGTPEQEIVSGREATLRISTKRWWAGWADLNRGYFNVTNGPTSGRTSLIETAGGYQLADSDIGTDLNFNAQTKQIRGQVDSRHRYDGQCKPGESK